MERFVQKSDNSKYYSVMNIISTSFTKFSEHGCLQNHLQFLATSSFENCLYFKFTMFSLYHNLILFLEKNYKK